MNITVITIEFDREVDEDVIEAIMREASLSAELAGALTVATAETVEIEEASDAEKV